MAATAKIQASLTINGLAQIVTLSGNSSYSMTGHNASVLTMDIGSAAWTAIPISPAASIAKLLIVVGTPAVSGTNIQLALDNAGAHIFCSSIPVGDAGLFPFPPATIYAKSDATGTDKVPILYCLAEQ